MLPNLAAETSVFHARRFLMLAGACSLLAAVTHLAIIAGGPDWYRFFGAPELADMQLSGSWRPAVITSGIAVILAIWAAYALCEARGKACLPWQRPVLYLIAAVYLLRGFAPLPVLTLLDLQEQSTAFMWWSSSICAAIGIFHALGLWFGRRQKKLA